MSLPYLLAIFIISLSTPTATMNSTTIPTNSSTITFGISLTTFGVSRSSSIGKFARDGLLFWKDWANQQYGGIWADGKHYFFDVFIMEDEGNETMVNQNYLKMLNNETGIIVDYYLGPSSSDLTIPLRPLFESRNKVILGTVCSASAFYYLSNWEYLTSVPAGQYLNAPVADLRFLGVQKVVAFIEANSFTKEACGTAFNQSLIDNGITLAKTYNLPSTNPYLTPSDMPPSVIAQFEAAVDDAISIEGIDVYFFCSYASGVLTAVQRMRARDFIPKAIYILPFSNNYPETNDLLNFASGVVNWTPIEKLAPDPYFGTPMQYAEKFQNKYNYTPTEYVALGTGAGLFMMLAIENANSLSQSDVRDSLERLNLDTFLGHVEYGVDHAQNREITGVQVIQGQFQVTSPFLGRTADLVYPIPRWDERYMDTQWGQPIEIVVLVLFLIGFGISIGLLCLSIYFREKSAFQISSPLFLYLFLVGSLILYISVLFWTLNATNVTCILRIWFLGIGLVLMFGSLFSKTYRVYTIIVMAKKLQKIIFSNAQLLGILGIILGIEILLLILWSSISPLYSGLVVVDPFRPVYSYYECTLNHTDYIFLIILGVYKFGLGIFGMVCSISIWNVPIQFFNESKQIGFAMYNLFFFVTLVVILELAVDIDHVVMFGIRSISLILATGISVISIFYPKVRSLLKPSTRERSSSVSTSTTELNINWQAKYYTLLKENEKLVSDLERLKGNALISE